MSDNTLFRPKTSAIRNPLDKGRHHGSVVNPPRMAEIGGFDKTKEAHGHFKNDMTIRKPGVKK